MNSTAPATHDPPLNRTRLGLPASLFRHDRVIRAAAGRWLRKDDQQRDHGERRYHQQLVIVDVSNHLRLLRNHCIQRGASGGRNWIPELRDDRICKGLERGEHVLHLTAEIGRDSSLGVDPNDAG